MELSKLYVDLLYDIGVSATYVGFYREADTMHRFGMSVDPTSRYALLALVQNEALRENYDLALSAIDQWEKAGNGLFPYLLWWKGVIAQISGQAYLAQKCVSSIRYELGDHEFAEKLELVLDALEDY